MRRAFWFVFLSASDGVCCGSCSCSYSCSCSRDQVSRAEAKVFLDDKVAEQRGRKAKKVRRETSPTGWVAQIIRRGERGGGGGVHSFNA